MPHLAGPGSGRRVSVRKAMDYALGAVGSSLLHSGDFYAIILLCHRPSIRKYVSPIRNARGQVHGFGSFSALWEEWTVQFGATDREERLGVSSPLTVVEGHIDEFPLQIAATLIDSTLIEAGLQHYATLLAMTPEEQADFRRAYCKRHTPANHLLIWCELQTIWAENYLAPRRWIIFLEDDAGNQYEPLQISEESPPIRQMVTERRSGSQPEQERRGWSVQQKALMFSFPKRNIHGTPVPSEKLKFLKLTFQLKGDEETRAEGVWVFKR